MLELVYEENTTNSVREAIVTLTLTADNSKTVSITITQTNEAFWVPISGFYNIPAIANKLTLSTEIVAISDWEVTSVVDDPSKPQPETVTWVTATKADAILDLTFENNVESNERRATIILTMMDDTMGDKILMLEVSQKGS